MMKFLTILATVFCGGTFWVGADYYIEFRAPAAPASSSRTSRTSRGQSSRGQSSAAEIINLYECVGDPAGTTAIQAPRSLCAPVTSTQRKAVIYSTCTFFDVHKARLRGHVIHLLDRNVMPKVAWMLGYSNHAIDHPDFADPTPQDIWYFQTQTEELGLDTVVPHYLVNNIASYFALTNLIAFSTNMVSANSYFLHFATLLRRITGKYDELFEENYSVTNIVAIRARLDNAAKVCLHKMIDPCSVLFGNLQKFASQYCATYCNFLNISATRFGVTSRSCASLEEGQCAGVVCMCLRVMSSPFAGCSSTPMLQCNNVLRMYVN